MELDGKGRAIDNIFIERLWRSVKYKNIYLQCYDDGKALYKGLQKYFDFYNHEIIQQSLKYATPASMYE
jgi:putative transposase